MFSPGIEPGTFCVLDRCDNRYTTKTHWHLRIIQPWHAQPGSLVAECARPNITRNPIAVLSRDRLVVRTLRCGRSNPGSNPGHGMDKIFLIQLFKFCTKKNASAGNRTRINCLEGSYADHYTTDACWLCGCHWCLCWSWIWTLVTRTVECQGCYRNSMEQRAEIGAVMRQACNH